MAEDNELIVKEMFTKKHPYKLVTKALAHLEAKEPKELIRLINKYHPQYIMNNVVGGEVMKFNIVSKLKQLYGKN